MNRLLDLLPRTTVHLGGREVPAFRSLGILGFHLAVLTALLAGVRAGVPALDVLALSAVAGASFFAWGLARRAVTGREALVLLEHVWVAMAAVAALRWASGVPVRPGLDVLAVALCPFLALGRVGCTVAGCCYGQPATVGVVYPASAGLPDRLAGVRLFPVGLVEATALLAIGVAGLALAGGPPGTATVWVLLAYATVRFGTEALRGDVRPRVAGLSVPRLMCAVQAAGALLLAELPGPVPARRAVVAGAVLAAVALAGALVARRRRDPLTAPEHLDELWRRIATLAAGARAGDRSPATAATSAGVRIAASWAERGLHVSLSHPERPVTGPAAALGLTVLARTGLAVHALVPLPRLPQDFLARLPQQARKLRPSNGPSRYASTGVASPDDGSYFGP